MAELGVVGTSAGTAAGPTLVLVGAVLALVQESATALNDPANTVAVPGVNAFVPVAAAPDVVAVLIAATMDAYLTTADR